MIAKLEPRMLAGHQQAWRLAESGKGMSNRAELDSFGTRSDDGRNTILAQLSPWLRRLPFHPFRTDRQVMHKRAGQARAAVQA